MKTTTEGNNVFTLPHVQLRVIGPSAAVVLTSDGARRVLEPDLRAELPDDLAQFDEDRRRQAGLQQERRSARDWWELRGQLIRLDVTRDKAVANWLNSAGYVQQGGSDWAAKDITPQLKGWIARQKSAIEWLSKIDQTRFRRAISAARDFLIDRGSVIGARVAHAFEQSNGTLALRNPGVDFSDAVGFPKSIDHVLLADFLIGASSAPSLHAWFHWDKNGRPVVTVPAGDPIQAIVLLIHYDQNFSKRHWKECDRPGCGIWFEQQKESDRYHDKSCKNYMAITESRKRSKKGKKRHER